MYEKSRKFYHSIFRIEITSINVLLLLITNINYVFINNISFNFDSHSKNLKYFKFNFINPVPKIINIAFRFEFYEYLSIIVNIALQFQFYGSSGKNFKYYISISILRILSINNYSLNCISIYDSMNIH